jgi:CRP-like cAMP-binding protein
MHPEPDRLLEVPLLADISAADRERIAGWLDVEHFQAGKVLAREGQSGYEFWIIADGNIRIEHENEEVATLGPGDVLGELAILGDGTRKAAAIAETDVEIFSMFGTNFRQMQSTVPMVDERLKAASVARLLEIRE